MDDPSIQLNEADVREGAALFVTCSLCHGKDAVSAGVAPDLRESPIPLSFGALRTVVHDGALRPHGMPAFEDLSDDQLRQIAAYVRSRARDALGAARDETPPSRENNRF